MEPSKDMVERIKKFVSESGEDVNVLKGRWEKSNIQDENLRAIQCGIFADAEAYRLYKAWNKWSEELAKRGITDIHGFWAESIEKNQEHIKTEQDAIKVVYEMLVTRLRSATKLFKGVILSVGVKRDNLSVFINQTLEAYKSDPARAIKYNNVKVFNDTEAVDAEFPGLSDKLSEKYFIDSNYVVPIGKKDITIVGKDGKSVTKKDWFGGRYNDKPVVGCAFMQTVDLVAKTKDDNKLKWYDMILSDEICDIEKPRNKIVEFEANESPNTDGRLNPVSRTTFKVIGDSDFDEIRKAVSKRELDFDDIPEYVNKRHGRGFDVKPIYIKVLDVFVSETGATILAGSPKERTIEEMEKLFDDSGKLKDNSFYFKVSEGIPINFARGSKILVFGTPTYGSKRVGDKWETDTTKYSAWINGILVPKNEMIDSTSVSVSQEEIDTTKWKEEKPDVEKPKEEEVVKPKEEEQEPAKEIPKEEEQKADNPLAEIINDKKEGEETWLG